MDPTLALDICRFGHDMAAALLWGTYSYLAWLVPKGLAKATTKQLARMRAIAILVVVVTSAVNLPVQVALIGQGWTDALDPAVTWSVLADTHVGHAWLWGAGASVLLAATLSVPPRWQPRATALASGLVLATLALTGHAAMMEGPLGALHGANDVVHVLSSGAWFGALLPLATILGRGGPSTARLHQEVALRTFSVAGHLAVALAIVTGLANTYLVVGGWPTDWSSPYQALLSLKVGLVLVMVTIACINRYRHVPRMAEDRPGALASIRRGAIGEIAIGTVVFGLVAIIGVLEPVPMAGA